MVKQKKFLYVGDLKAAPKHHKFLIFHSQRKEKNLETFPFLEKKFSSVLKKHSSSSSSFDSNKKERAGKVHSEVDM